MLRRAARDRPIQRRSLATADSAPEQRRGGSPPPRADGRGVDYDVKEYSHAGRGFLNDQEGTAETVPILFIVVGKPTGTRSRKAQRKTPAGSSRSTRA